MAGKVPLNKFRSRYVRGDNFIVNASPNSVDITDLKPLYYGQQQLATIVILAQATNTTSNDQTVYLAVSSSSLNGGISGFPVAWAVLIPPYDAKSLLTGRLVIQGIDGGEIKNNDVLLYGTSNSGVTLSLGLLETKNTD